jgi:hypothetical protein
MSEPYSRIHFPSPHSSCVCHILVAVVTSVSIIITTHVGRLRTFSEGPGCVRKAAGRDTNQCIAGPGFLLSGLQHEAVD